MDLNRFVALLQSDQKWRVFGYILLAILVIGTVLSLFARVAILRDNKSTRPRVALVAPKGSANVKLLRQGAELYAETLNRQGGFKGRQLEIVDFEETSKVAESIVADKRVVAVIGHLDINTLKASAPLYAGKKLPVVTTIPLTENLPGITSMALDLRDQARFVANYARNIQLRRFMYVVREAGAEYDPLVEPFADVYKRFETPVKQIWVIPSSADAEAKIKSVLDEIKNIDIGSVYLATSPELAARLVKGIRETGNTLDIFGPSQLASGEFAQKLTSLSGKNATTQSHGIIVATPTLFDTANEDAQRFQTRYQQKFGASPDWLATSAFDAVKVALSPKPGVDDVQGISGTLSFADGRVQMPILMGVYNGERIISAPVQLLPIAKGASFDYIEALRNGRVLYVNDRFMFKTNVVYVGVTLNEVSELDMQKEVATIDMSIWFRYRGSFDPHDLQIPNAVEPVKFEKPEESKESDEVQYRRYRIKQKFKLNFTDAKRSYGQHIAGLTFRHRLLNRNNLFYVVDVLGMPTGNSLIEDLHKRKVVTPGSGWVAESAWVSQDVVRERGEGAPQYVGMTGEQPLFSTITLGMLLKPATPTASDMFDHEHFIYIGIFGFLGAFFALVLDAKKWGKYWAFQSWLLRLLFWPLVLLSVGNLSLDWAYANLSPTLIRYFVVMYESLWWLIGARLADKAIRRYVWESLEAKSGRNVPNVMKFFVTLVLFALALSGVIAFVFGKTLTSMLATSGVLAMVVGLAVQANIANVFSGVILNVERPFKVGDFIKINNLIGQVKDITWRTTRIESNDGQTLILANSRVSEAFMENFSIVPHGIHASTTVYTQADADPEAVLGIITEAIALNKFIIKKDEPEFAPSARFRGIVNVNGYWVAEFSASYRVKILPKKSEAKEAIWKHVRARFVEKNIDLVPANGPIVQGFFESNSDKPAGISEGIATHAVKS
jgi:small-conductance mechanosensitive channel/ABC-type branched-subunit amino acid transport system substrate-binding protein